MELSGRTANCLVLLLLYGKFLFILISMTPHRIVKLYFILAKSDNKNIG